MANALQFIESNIEDLEKEEVQKEIVKNFISSVTAERATHPKIASLETRYSENGGTDSLTFDEMRFVEEIL